MTEASSSVRVPVSGEEAPTPVVGLATCVSDAAGCILGKQLFYVGEREEAVAGWTLGAEGSE